MKEQSIARPEASQAGQSVSSRDMSPVPPLSSDLAESLAASPFPHPSTPEGEGIGFSLGDAKANLTFWHRSNTVEYATPEAQITLYDIEKPEIRQDSVVFSSRTEDFENRLLVSREGEVVFTSHRLQETTDEEPLPAAEPVQVEHETSSNTDPESKEQEKVNIVGRAERNPRVSQTKSGVTVAKFRLGEHITDEQGNEVTIWHNVVAFRDRAKLVSDSVKQGDIYRVVGYRHEQERADGKTEVEIYAVSVRPPGKKKATD